jgi:anti-anti-sigma factor
LLTQPTLGEEMAGVPMADCDVGVSQCEAATFRWSRRCRDGAVVVSLAGEVDLAAVELEPLLLQVAESGPAATIVLDMSELDFIDAYGIGTIVNAWKVAKARGRVLRVEGLRGLPARVFRLAELEPMLVRPPCRDDLKGNPGDQRRAASGGGGGISVGGAHESR